MTNSGAWEAIFVFAGLIGVTGIVAYWIRVGRITIYGRMMPNFKISRAEQPFAFWFAIAIFAVICLATNIIGMMTLFSWPYSK